jgi:hypothetical protein
MRRDSRLRRERGQREFRWRARPLVEGLEGRQLLYATTGGVWPHPNLITFSFVPDGTNVAGYGSNLFQTLNAKFPTATWESVFEQAAAIWEQVANINLSLVGDDGEPMGSGSYQQGNPNFGDIRISGLPSSVLGSGTLAYTVLPPPINGGSSAGDIVMNTSQAWHINSDYDLLTVAIHEFGHALGMGHSAISTADMYGVYNGIKQSLTGDDIAGIDSIYGPRAADWFMTNYNNSTPARAADLTPFLTSQGQFGFGSLDLQSPQQSEWFRVTVPASSTGTMQVAMQAAGLSLLSPFVAIYNASGAYLGGVGNYNNYGGTAIATVPGVSPGQVYYIQTLGDGISAVDDGAYGLLVNFGTNPLYPVLSPVTTALNTLGIGGGGSADSGGNGNGNGHDQDHGHDHGHGHDGSGDDGDANLIPGSVGDALIIGDGSGSVDSTSSGAADPLLLIAPAGLADDGTVTGTITPTGPLKKAAPWWLGGLS